MSLENQPPTQPAFGPNLGIKDVVPKMDLLDTWTDFRNTTNDNDVHKTTCDLLNTPDPERDFDFDSIVFGDLIEDEDSIALPIEFNDISCNNMQNTWDLQTFKKDNDDDTAFGNDPLLFVNPMEAEGMDTSKNDTSSDEVPFDLLDFVCDKTLDINDPTFQAYLRTPPVQTTNPFPFPTPGEGKVLMEKPETIKTEDIEEEYVDDHDDDSDYIPEPVVVKRGRGRPRVQRTQPDESTKRPRGRPIGSVTKNKVAPALTSVSRSSFNTDHSYDSSASTSEDPKSAKYRRMRDLNNQASKRCRLKRRNKLACLVEEEKELKERNANLKIKVGQMEELVSRLKSKLIHNIANPTRPVVIPSATVTSSTSAEDQFEVLFEANVM